MLRQLTSKRSIRNFLATLQQWGDFMRSLSQEKERDQSLAREHLSDEESDRGETVSWKKR